MRRDPVLPLIILAVAALVAVGAAVTFGLAASDSSRPVPTIEPARPDGEESRQPRVPGDPSAGDAAISQAVAYALAARNWTPGTYLHSWNRQLKLAGGSYRRALAGQRPTPSELDALREDRAGSEASVVGADRDQLVRPPAARVLVALNEVTAAAGQTIRGLTVNEVRLRLHQEQWVVIGWTVVPEGAMPGGD
jgi:hypothetical protein